MRSDVTVRSTENIGNNGAPFYVHESLEKRTSVFTPVSFILRAYEKRSAPGVTIILGSIDIVNLRSSRLICRRTIPSTLSSPAPQTFYFSRRRRRRRHRSRKPSAIIDTGARRALSLPLSLSLSTPFLPSPPVIIIPPLYCARRCTAEQT